MNGGVVGRLSNGFLIKLQFVCEALFNQFMLRIAKYCVCFNYKTFFVILFSGYWNYVCQKAAYKYSRFI